MVYLKEQQVSKVHHQGAFRRSDLKSRYNYVKLVEVVLAESHLFRYYAQQSSVEKGLH